MVSDTLSTAAAEIRDYLRRMPDVYVSERKPLLALLREMDKIRKRLDTPPVDNRKSIRGTP